MVLKISRRHLLQASAALAAAPALGTAATAPASAQEPNWKHALSLFDELKYPTGFKHFDYVNPAAPKGGTVRMMAIGTFDNFNPVVGGVKGAIAIGLSEARKEGAPCSHREVGWQRCLELDPVHADRTGLCFRQACVQARKIVARGGCLRHARANVVRAFGGIVTVSRDFISTWAASSGSESRIEECIASRFDRRSGVGVVRGARVDRASRNIWCRVDERSHRSRCAAGDQGRAGHEGKGHSNEKRCS